jgi:hypothetical protein
LCNFEISSKHTAESAEEEVQSGISWKRVIAIIERPAEINVDSPFDWSASWGGGRREVRGEGSEVGKWQAGRTIVAMMEMMEMMLSRRRIVAMIVTMIVANSSYISE